MWLGLLLLLAAMALMFLLDDVADLPGMAILAVFVLFFAGLVACLAGVAMTTSAPRGSRVARWGFGILGGLSLAWIWPVVVWATDLPAAAYPEFMEWLPVAMVGGTACALAGLMAAICRWFAEKASPGESRSVDWTRLARGATWLFRAGCLWTVIVVGMESAMDLAFAWLGMAGLLLVPLVMLAQIGATIAAPLWGIWFIVTAVRFERAVRRSSPRIDAAEGSLPTPTAERFDRLGLAAGVLSIAAFFGNWWAEASLAPGWERRHAAELAARAESQWVEMESDAEATFSRDGTPNGSETPDASVRQATWIEDTTFPTPHDTKATVSERAVAEEPEPLSDGYRPLQRHRLTDEEMRALESSSDGVGSGSPNPEILPYPDGSNVVPPRDAAR